MHVCVSVRVDVFSVNVCVHSMHMCALYTPGQCGYPLCICVCYLCVYMFSVHVSALFACVYTLLMGVCTECALCKRVGALYAYVCALCCVYVLCTYLCSLCMCVYSVCMYVWSLHLCVLCVCVLCTCVSVVL